MSTELTIATHADEQLISLWLFGRSPHTQRAYRADVERFVAFVGKPISQVTLDDLQAFAESLGPLAPSSRKRTLSAIKSLLAFGNRRLGVLPVNVGAALPLPGIKDQLAERILAEDEVVRMIALEPDRRNHALLRLIYVAGLRASEACRLRWRDFQARDEAGQITVYGKGEKTRAILIPTAVWRELVALRGDADRDVPVFPSARGGHLDASQVWRIVREAARRAGIESDVSPHWLRHAHASHALDRGAPISLVQATLGHSSVATTGRYLHARPSDSSGMYLAV